MDPHIIGYLGFALVLVLLAFRVPIAIALGSVATGGMLLAYAWTPWLPFSFSAALGPVGSLLSTTPIDFINSYALSTVPLFIFIGHYRSVTRNISVVGFTFETIYMKSDIVLSAGQIKTAKFAIVNRGVVGLHIAFDADGHFTGDTVIHHVDYPADSTAAVLQGSRAAQYFNLGRTGAVCRYVMVGADTRYIRNIQSILHNLNPWTIVTADHRATGHRAKVSTMHPGRVF